MGRPVGLTAEGRVILDEVTVIRYVGRRRRDGSGVSAGRGRGGRGTLRYLTDRFAQSRRDSLVPWAPCRRPHGWRNNAPGSSQWPTWWSASSPGIGAVTTGCAIGSAIVG